MKTKEFKQAVNDEVQHFDKSYKDLFDVQYLKQVRYYGEKYDVIDIHRCNNLLCLPLLKHYLLMKEINRSLQKM